MIDVKICGLTTITDARVAMEAGADFLGFVMHAASPRSVSLASLERIADALGPGVRMVGVFVNSPPAWVREIAVSCGLAAVQIHGDEAAADFVSMPVPVWRAVNIGVAGCCPCPAEWPAARYVVDAALPGVYGGSGVQADWVQAASLARQVPVMLAGGLRPENVETAIRRVRPLGVDVASGVEARPGHKSHTAMRAFIASVRRAQSMMDDDGVV